MDTSTLTEAVDAITAALDNRDLAGAWRCFDATATDSGTVAALVQQLAATVTIPAGMVVWGYGLDVWANPYRAPDERAWRCGGCRWTASLYKTDQAALASAGKHNAEHHGGRLLVVSCLDEVYRKAVEEVTA